MKRMWAIALAGGLALLVWRLWPAGGEDAENAAKAPETAREGADEEVSEGPQGGASALHAAAQGGPLPRPVRMRSSGPTGPNPGLATAFAAEERDAGWAKAHEDEVRARAAAVIASAGSEGQALAVKVSQIECRARTCRLSVAAEDASAVARAVEAFGEERGFYRFADQMAVTAAAADATDEGPRQVEIFLKFSR